MDAPKRGAVSFPHRAGKHIALDLIETRTFGSRVIFERYRRARDESDCQRRPRYGADPGPLPHGAEAAGIVVAGGSQGQGDA